MDFFKTLGNLFHGAQNFAGGLVRGAGQVVNNVTRPQQRPQPQQRVQPVRRPAPVIQPPKINLRAVTNALKSIDGRPLQNAIHGIANTHLQGVEQLTGKPATIGSVAKSTPILGDAIKFGQGSAKATVPQFVKGIAATGAKAAPYVAPELKVVKPGATLLGKVGAKFANNAIPAALTSVPASIATGQHNPVKITQEALNAAMFNGAFGVGTKAAGKLAGAVKTDAKAGFPALNNQAGKLGGTGGLQPIKPTKKIQTMLDQAAAKEAGVKLPMGKTPKVATPTMTEVPPITYGKQVQNKLTTGGKEGRQNISPEVQQAISGIHNRRSTESLLNNASGNADKQGTDLTIQAAHDALAVPDGQINDQTVALAHQAIERADAVGRHEDASAIHDALSHHLTKNGQTVQAASLLYQRSPQGIFYKAQRDLKKAGVEVSAELKKELQAHVDKIKSLPPGSPERNRAQAELSQKVLKHMPQKAGDNLIGVWKAGLLSGAKTQGGNFASNATFSGLSKLSDPLATGIDKLISLKTGERTKTTTLKGILGGAREGAAGGIDTLRTGIDKRNITGNKYEQHAEINFKNPIVQKVLGNPANLVFRGMSAADQPFYYANLKNNLYDLAKADGLNQGLKGKELKAYMEKTVQAPSEKIMQAATNAAEKAVLGQDNLIASKVSALARAVPGGQVVVPFIKVPTNFLGRVLDYTPIGAIKEIGTQAVKKKFDQRALSTAISEATTGSALVYLGSQLAQGDLLSGDYPKTDPKEQARWKAEGITPNSVKIGNQWISLNYLGPVGLLFNAGKTITDASKQGNGNEMAAALAGLGQGLLGQSFLQGFSGFSDAIKDPERNASSYVRSQAGSVVPSWLNDIGNLTDNMQRQTNSITDAMKARLPFAREGLTPKIDAFGNDLSQAAGGANAALNPLKPSDGKDSPLLSELNRLGKADQAVFPTTTKTIGQGDTLIKLTPGQQVERQKQVGKLLTPLWNEIVNNPEYAKLDDEHKKDALQRALTDINSAVDRTMTAKIDSSKLKKAATGSVADILEGHVPSSDDYIVKASGRPTNPAQKYQADLAQYKRDVKDGKLSAADKFKKEQDLGKQAIISKYSQDVIDLYGMSKAQLKAFFEQNPDKQNLYEDMTKLDAELAGKSWIKSPKFKYGLGSGAGKGGRKKGKGKLSPRPVHLAKLGAKGAPKITQARARKLNIKVASSKQPSKSIKITA